MTEYLEKSASKSVDEAIRRIVNADHFRTGSIVSMPTTYPSGTTVTLEITFLKDRCFVSDRGGGYQEAEFSGAIRYFKRDAESIAQQSGLSFDGQQMFIAEVVVDCLDGAMIAVANASAQAANMAIQRQMENVKKDTTDALYGRLSMVYRGREVIKDAEVVGASNHKWRISVMVNQREDRAFFEPVSNHYISVVGTAAKFHDFDQVDIPPKRISVVKSKIDLGDFYGVIAGASNNVVELSAPDSQFQELLAA